MGLELSEQGGQGWSLGHGPCRALWDTVRTLGELEVQGQP